MVPCGSKLRHYGANARNVGMSGLRKNSRKGARRESTELGIPEWVSSLPKADQRVIREIAKRAGGWRSYKISLGVSNPAGRCTTPRAAESTAVEPVPRLGSNGMSVEQMK